MIRGTPLFYTPVRYLVNLIQSFVNLVEYIVNSIYS